MPDIPGQLPVECGQCGAHSTTYAFGAITSMAYAPKYTYAMAHSEEICSQYRAGNSQKSIADALGLDQRIIRRVLDAHNVPIEPGQSGARSCRWRGGKSQTRQGYLRVTIPVDHPYSQMADQRKYILEHRLVMAEHLGRSLESYETVHHKNGDKLDNRIENLQLLIGTHAHGVVPYCLDCGSCRIGHQDLIT